MTVAVALCHQRLVVAQRDDVPRADEGGQVGMPAVGVGDPCLDEGDAAIMRREIGAEGADLGPAAIAADDEIGLDCWRVPKHKQRPRGFGPIDS
jgi:hypothetical protein